MIRAHTFPMHGRHLAPLALLSQARIFRRYVTDRFTPNWEAATTCRIYWKWHWQNRPTLRRRNPAGNTKRQAGPSFKTWLTFCAKNLTLPTARTSMPVSSSWLTAYFRQQSRPSPEAEGRTTSLTEVTTYSASMTNSQKPENNLSSPLHQSAPSSTTRQGLLLRKKRTRKPASHGKQRLAHSTWRKTHRSSGIWQRPWMTISSMPQEQSFWRKVPRCSWARRQPTCTCLQTVSERTACLVSEGETSRHPNENPGTTAETISNSQHDILCSPSMSWIVLSVS